MFNSGAFLGMVRLAGPVLAQASYPVPYPEPYAEYNKLRQKYVDALQSGDDEMARYYEYKGEELRQAYDIPLNFKEILPPPTSTPAPPPPVETPSRRYIPRSEGGYYPAEWPQFSWESLPPATAPPVKTPATTSKAIPVENKAVATQSASHTTQPAQENPPPYAPVATGGGSSDCSHLGPYAYWDGRQCRSANMTQAGGGLLNQAMNLGPSGGSSGISPGNLDFNPGGYGGITAFGMSGPSIPLTRGIGTRALVR